jgi:biotin synthase-like enzyme
MFAAGANSTMVGNYLTTRGWSAEKDHEMIRDLGLLSENRHDLPAPRGAVA